MVLEVEEDTKDVGWIVNRIKVFMCVTHDINMTYLHVALSLNISTRVKVEGIFLRPFLICSAQTLTLNSGSEIKNLKICQKTIERSML